MQRQKTSSWKFLPAHHQTVPQATTQTVVKYGTHLYMWHDASGVWVQFGNASDISSLETRLSQQEAECDSDVSSLESKDSSLETRISSEEVARASAVSSANVRAVAAEGSLETRLSAEEVARAADVNAEESRALLAEGSTLRNS